MAVPTTAVTLSSIQTEFGGTNPISLSAEYFRGGANVPANQATSATDGTPIPTTASTLIRMGMFRGLSKIVGQVYPSGSGIWSGSGVSTTGAQASVSFNADGTTTVDVLDAGDPGSTVTDLADWWTAAPQTGIGSSYWIRATVNSGTGGTFSGTTGSWLQLSANRSWSVSSSTGVGIRTLTLEISSSATGSPVLATYTNVVLRAEGIVV